MKALTNRILYFLLICFLINVLTILFVCIPNTQWSLPTNRMVIYPLVCVSAFSLLGFILNKLSFFTSPNPRMHFALLLIFLFIYSVILYWSSLKLYCIPKYDDDHVRTHAMYLTGLSSSCNWDYLAMFPNNIPLALVLSAILQLGKLLGMKDPVHLAILFNVLQIDIAIFCVYHLILRFCNKTYKYAISWVSVCIFSVNLAALGHTQSTYTDAMTISLGVLGFYIWCHINHNQKLSTKIILSILSGAIWGLGSSLKITVLISFIAVIIYVFFCENIRENILSLFIILFTIITIFTGFQIYSKTLPSEALRDQRGMPKFSYFVAIGLKGNGSYIENGEYILLMNSIHGMDAKEEASIKYIKENFHEFFNIYHIKFKAICNFGFGCLGSEDFTEIPREKNLLYEICSIEGIYFKRFAMACTSYFYSILILLSLGIITSIRSIRKYTSYNKLEIVTYITILGIMIYVMTFEANNRQLYNHFAWFVLGATLGIETIISLLNKILVLLKRETFLNKKFRK